MAGGGGRVSVAQVRSHVFDSQKLSDIFSCYSHTYITSNSPYLRGGQTKWLPEAHQVGEVFSEGCDKVQEARGVVCC